LSLVLSQRVSFRCLDETGEGTIDRVERVITHRLSGADLGAITASLLQNTRIEVGGVFTEPALIVLNTCTDLSSPSLIPTRVIASLHLSDAHREPKLNIALLEEATRVCAVWEWWGRDTTPIQSLACFDSETGDEAPKTLILPVFFGAPRHAITPRVEVSGFAGVVDSAELLAILDGAHQG
jgi:hypothetical protein